MPRTRTSSDLELHLPLSRERRGPLGRQLEHGLREAIRAGRLAPEAVLPSSRNLAGQLGLSRGVVVEAYEQLVAEGYLTSRPGGATTVARGAVRLDRPPPDPVRSTFAFDFRPGRPQLDQFPRAAWLRSVRRVLNAAPADLFGYLDGRPVAEIRVALADYLNRVRGTVANPAGVVITAGFAQSLVLLCQVLRADGVRRIGIEDPSHADWRAIVRANGLEPIPIPVDQAGLVTDRLDAAGIGAVVVTAVHQYPTGAVLAAERRAALLAWAERSGGLVVEDDYDAEFRYDREPVGALQGLAPDRVALLSTVSKSLAPAMRLGWIACPTGLAEAIAYEKTIDDRGSPALDQLALATLIRSGRYDRHLRRMRASYARRRQTLVDALAQHAPRVELGGLAAGFHAVAHLPDSLSEPEVVAAARTRSVGLYGMSQYRSSGATRPPQLVLGFGNLRESAIARGIATIGDLLQ